MFSDVTAISFTFMPTKVGLNSVPDGDSSQKRMLELSTYDKNGQLTLKVKRMAYFLNVLWGFTLPFSNACCVQIKDKVLLFLTRPFFCVVEALNLV